MMILSSERSTCERLNVALLLFCINFVSGPAKQTTATNEVRVDRSERGERDTSDDPLCVSQSCSSEKKMIIAQRICSSIPLEVAFEPIQIVVRRFTEDVSCAEGQSFLSFARSPTRSNEPSNEANRSKSSASS